MKFEDFLSFDKMITPTIIKIIYYFLVIFAVIGSVISIFTGIMSPWGGGIMVFGGLIGLVLGPLWARVLCESMIVMFKINDSLTSIDKNLQPEERLL